MGEDTTPHLEVPAVDVPSRWNCADILLPQQMQATIRNHLGLKRDLLRAVFPRLANPLRLRILSSSRLSTLMLILIGVHYSLLPYCGLLD